MNGKSPVQSSDDNSSSSLVSSISSLSIGSETTTSSSQDSILDPPLAAIIEDKDEDEDEDDIDKFEKNHYSDSSSLDDDIVPIIKAPQNLSFINESNESINNTTSNNNTIDATSGKYELGPHQPKNQRDIDKRSIYVSNIPFKISPWKLKQLFSDGTDTIKGCGEKSVNRVTILCDRFTGLPKGYAYIEFANDDYVNNAIKFNGIELDGRIIGVVPKRTNIPYINDSNFNKIPNNKLRNDNNNKFLNRNKTVNRHVCNDNNNNNNNNNDNNDNNKDKKYSRDNITQVNKNNRLNGFQNFNTKNYSNKKNGFNKYKNFSNSTPHSNSNYIFMNGQSRSYNNNDNKNNNNNNNNKLNHNYNRVNNYVKNKSSSSNGSNFQSLSKPSKLIIDNNHYLTPSSRVGVYNNNLNEN